MNASTAYERGYCRDCRARIQPYGPSSRCVECTKQHEAYTRSLWGLDEVVRERMKYEALGLCFHCGTGLERTDGRLCAGCTERSDQGRWVQEMTRKGGKPIEENPYKSVWDCNEVDNSTYLTPTLGTAAERLFAKARHFRHKAERGGPRGRDDAREAFAYQRMAERLQRSYLNVSKYK